MLRIARAVLYAVVPAELLLAVLLLSGVPVPGPVLAVAEPAVGAVLLLEVAVLLRLFRAARRGGAGRRAALRAAADRLVPEQVRRVLAFDLKGMASLVLWVLRRRDGVPARAVAVPYAGEQSALILVMLFVMTVETVVVEVLLRGLGVAAGLRTVILVLDLYGILFALAFAAACATRPHVVSAGELRVRFGAFFDLRVPRELISSVRLSRVYNEPGMVTVEGGRLGVAVSSQTNVVVELTGPVTIVRPLGRRAEVTTVRFFADDPGAALSALRPLRQPAAP
ncbi:hypothetical protein [Sphaerisporangium perillae]|uniref:hypothetical protein n=1 Tax=Sphaerisporangium perillae TaxID=2935860 RepID=UPI00200E995B|nr:hypothetical protein [Sphaerisporangium perillae]